MLVILTEDYFIGYVTVGTGAIPLVPQGPPRPCDLITPYVLGLRPGLTSWAYVLGLRPGLASWGSAFLYTMLVYWPGELGALGRLLESHACNVGQRKEG